MTMKETILSASVSSLVEGGLNNWSVDRVARRAGCAKGLVNYHFQAKATLIAASAETIGERRHRRRTDALSAARGADAVDALWATVVEDVRSGTFGAWVEITAFRTPVARDPLAAAVTLRNDLARALEVSPSDVPDGLTIAALLDGMSLALLEGVPEADAQSAYQMAWLGMLG